MTLNKNTNGFSHLELFVFLITVVAIAFIGVRLINYSHAAPLTAAQPVPTNWIITDGAIKNLEAAGATTTDLNPVFNSPNTYFVSQGSSGLFPSATNTQTFTSYATFQTAVTNKQISPNIKAILYDPEDWQYTPANEQQNPIQYVKEVSTLAHANGYQLIYTPASNLANVLMPGNSNRFNAFISLDILGQAAPYADVIEFQAQDLEGTPSFKDTVKQASEQVNGASAHGKLFVGIASNPNGQNISYRQLRNDYRLVQNMVSGYWLNIAAQSSYCPSCGTGNAPAALQLLQSF